MFNPSWQGEIRLQIKCIDWGLLEVDLYSSPNT